MVQQLSKQDHYDFGLRSMRGVLVCAGSLKRADASIPEELILLRALRDMNVPKFIREDMDLFLLLISDLFPGSELPPSSYGELQTSIENELKKQGLQVLPVNIAKAIQLYESKAYSPLQYDGRPNPRRQIDSVEDPGGSAHLAQ